jgi:flagellar hook-basal body complex protein FliE
MTAPQSAQSSGEDASTSLTRAINEIAKQPNAAEYKSKEFVDDSSDDDLALVLPQLLARESPILEREHHCHSITLY